MPRTLVNKIVYDKNGIQIRIEETVYTFIEQMITKYKIDLTDTYSKKTKDVLKLKEFLNLSFDWEKVIKMIPKKKNLLFIILNPWFYSKQTVLKWKCLKVKT
jgi:hypothetical protein